MQRRYSFILPYKKYVSQNLRYMNSIQNKLILIFIICVLVTIGITGFIVVKYEAVLVSNEQLSEQSKELQNRALKAQIYFKTQIQEWKNILLRGYDKQLYDKYLNSFLLYEKKTRQEAEHLSVLAEKYPELKYNVVAFIAEHKKISILYSEGLSIYNTTKYNPQIAADKKVRGIDREPIKLLERALKNSIKVHRIKLKNLRLTLKEVKRDLTIIYISIFISLAIFFWFAVKKWVSQPFNEELRRKHQFAMTDGLTGIANRHAYNEQITKEIERYKRNNSPFTLLLFDIDKFKSINDNYGHEMGDTVIIDVANILKNNIREIDFVYRYGGEEFVILLPDTNVNAAELVANKLRMLVEHNEFNFNNERVIVTVSAGFAEIKVNETKKEIFEHADAALYEAKNSGRNKCVKAGH